MKTGSTSVALTIHDRLNKRLATHTCHDANSCFIGENLANALLAVDDDPIGTLAEMLTIAFARLPTPEPMDPYEHDIVMAGEALREAAEHFIDALCQRDSNLPVTTTDDDLPY